MPHRSIRERTANLDRLLLSRDRYVDAKLELQASTGETLITVGGCWDRLKKTYVDRPCEARVIKLKKSQDAMGRGVADFVRKRLAGDDSRPLILMGIGNRGGGKTFLCAIIIVLLALALPHTWQMAISITAKQNRELKDAISQIAIPQWIENDIQDFRDPRTKFLTGVTVLWLTSKNHRALRQAQLKFEHVCINEGQDQREQIYLNSISALRNTGGALSIATNPPTEETGAGDWVAFLFEGLQERPDIGFAYELDAADNDAVNQPARKKIGDALRIVSPAQYEADALGLVKLAGNVGYPGFSRQRRRETNGRWVGGHIGDPPAPIINIHGEPVPELGWVDVTRIITAQTGHAGSAFDYIAGCDFQTDPGCCAVIGKLYRTPRGELVLWVKEFVGSTGTEAELTAALNSRGYFPGSVDYDGRPAASCLLVGDATGARQNAEHRKRDPYSFTRLRAEGGWTILPPSFIRNQKGGKTPWNPLVSDSRRQIKSCFLKGLLLISPACSEPEGGFPALIESLARAKMTVGGKFDKKGHHTHGPDGVRYLSWRFLPRNDVPKPGGGLDTETFNELRTIKIFQDG